MQENADTAELEARRRERQNWPVRIGRLSELEADDTAPTVFYCGDVSNTTVEERFAIVWVLSQKAWQDKCRQNPQPPGTSESEPS